MTTAAQRIDILKRKQKSWVRENKKFKKEILSLINAPSLCSAVEKVKVLEWCLWLPSGFIVPALQVSFEGQVATGSQKKPLERAFSRKTEPRCW